MTTTGQKLVTLSGLPQTPALQQLAGNQQGGMTTTGQQIVNLSGLPSATALTHFAAIQQGSGLWHPALVGASVVNVGLFSDFDFDQYDAWEDFLFANGLSHARYNFEIQSYGIEVNSSDLIDFDSSENGRKDWLKTHAQEHTTISIAIGMNSGQDLEDVELHDKSQFAVWLQIHQQAHLYIDQLLQI